MMNTVNYEIWCKQLLAEKEQLEQQLAQAREEIEKGNAAIQENVKLREEIEFLHIVIDDRVAERDDLRAENASMRALLEDASGTMEEAAKNHEDADAVGALHASIRRIDAFLAQHPQ